MAATRLRWAVNTSSWTPSEQEWVSALGIIQSEEVTRIRQFVYQRDAKFALVGRLLIWAGLCEHKGGDRLQGCRLIRNERGKPLLGDEAEEEAVSFNVSHQGDYVVLATERGRAVGVDVMQLSKPRGTSLKQFFHTMRRQFTDKEWLQISPSPSTTLPERQQLSNFYRFWCLKESFIKAEGSGLVYGLQNLEFIGSSNWPPNVACCCEGSELYIRGELTSAWQFQEHVLDAEHCVAVCVGSSASKQKAPPTTFSLVTVPWLLRKLQGLQRETYPSLISEWQLYIQKQLQSQTIK